MRPEHPDGRVLVQEVHARLVASLDGDADPEPAAAELVRRVAPLLPERDADAVVDGVVDRIQGLGPLEPLLADDAVTDVLVNGPGPVWVERDGRLVETSLTLGREEIDHLVERVTAPLGVRIDRQRPFADARLGDGSRAHALLPPVAVDGPYLTIRRFRTSGFALADLAPPEATRLLRTAVVEHANVVVSGGTGSGKTTLLNALAAEFAPAERVITVEDAAELRLPGRHVIRLEARAANAEGAGEVTVRELLRNALRMRPDRIVVGEVRGREAFDLLQALNTGHDGSLATCHANGPADALRRLAAMAHQAELGLSDRSVTEQVHSAIDLVVHMVRRGPVRRVDQIAEVAGPAATDAHAVVHPVWRAPGPGGEDRC